MTHLVVTTSELLLSVYESCFIFYRLAFGDHFCGSFGKLKGGAICMSLFYMHFLTLLFCLFFNFELSPILPSRNLMGQMTNIRFNLS